MLRQGGITFPSASIERVHPEIKQPETISFRNYKIDYGRCLGKGRYAEVYVVVPRPKEEGCWANLCPYLYDWIYPVTDHSIESKYCVKIFKSCILDREWRQTPLDNLDNVKHLLYMFDQKK